MNKSMVSKNLKIQTPRGKEQVAEHSDNDHTLAIGKAAMNMSVDDSINVAPPEMKVSQLEDDLLEEQSRIS